MRDEGGFTGLKLRLGRPRLSDDLKTLDAIRKALGDDIELMVDFNQGLDLADACSDATPSTTMGSPGSRSRSLYDNLDGYANSRPS